MSRMARRKIYFVVGWRNPLSFIWGGKFQATNSANSRSRKGTLTSTDDAILILSLYVRLRLVMNIFVSRYSIWCRKSASRTRSNAARWQLPGSDLEASVIIGEL